jgi:hypothetical protein
MINLKISCIVLAVFSFSQRVTHRNPPAGSGLSPWSSPSSGLPTWKVRIPDYVAHNPNKKKASPLPGGRKGSANPQLSLSDCVCVSAYKICWIGELLGWDFYCACVTLELVFSVYILRTHSNILSSPSFKGIDQWEKRCVESGIIW